MLSAIPVIAWSAPQGGEIVSGSGSIQTPDTQTTVVTQNSQTLSINWQSLNLSADELLRFEQPGSEAAALNHILDQNPSEILGQIEANGRIFLMNPNGIIFGESARINVGSLVAGTLQMDFESLKENDEFSFVTGAGTVENNGQITTEDGGSVALVGKSVGNHGQINARLGKIQLLSADAATVSFDADGLIQFSIQQDTLQNAASTESALHNTGTLQADGGYVVLEAHAANDVFTNVVNNEGLIQANRISNEGGVIRLLGTGGNVINTGDINALGLGAASGGEISLLGDRVGVYDNAVIDASGQSGGGSIAIGGYRKGSGSTTAEFTQVTADTLLRADALDSGQGGEVVVWADNTTWATGAVSAKGGTQSGDGGFVEISGKQGLVMAADVDLTATTGNFGTLLLDPTDITIHDQADGAQGDDASLPDLSNVTRGAGTFDIGELALEGLAGTSNLVLEATNNITINDLADNLLNFNINTGGSITMTADTDGVGGGSFTMNAGDTISTQGGSLSISAANVTLGTLDTDGALDGSIVVNSTGSASISSAISGTQSISIAIDTDANGTESLTIGGALSGTGISLIGGSNGGDTLIGPNLANTWTITSLNTGTLNGATFSSFTNLTGGSDDDAFTVTGIGSITGQYDGGGETTGDTVDYSGATGIVSVTLNNDVTNIENLIGGGADYSLIAENVANTWVVTSQNDGTVAGVSFTDFSNLTGGTGSDDFILSGGSITGTINGGTGADSLAANNTSNSWNVLSANGGNVDGVFAFVSIENLTGGTGSDTFILNSGSISGAIDGGAGNDSLAADNVANIWNISSNDAGTVTGIGSFTNIENLNGRNATDDFSVADGVSISGTIDGGGGTDTIDLSTQTGVVVVDLGGTSYANIEQYTGNGANSTIIGANAPNVWSINGIDDGVNDGVVGTVSFIDFANVTGGSNTDSFSLSTGILTGALDGGAGTDTLIGDNAANTWTISGADSGTATGVGSFLNVENLTGNADTDNFAFGATGSLSGVVNGATNSDTVDFSAVAGAVSVTMGSAGFANIETFVGNNANSTIIGDNVVNDWVITGANDGTVTTPTLTTTFTDFNNLTGGTNSDTFTISGGSISGTVDGGAGSDTLIGDAMANTWSISGSDSGTVSGVAGFSNMENLTGNSSADDFVFGVGGSLSGIFNGASGADSVDYSAKVGAVNVDLSSTNFISIETFTGNNTNSTLIGVNAPNTWSITGNNDGTVGTTVFVDFNNLNGNDNTDNFILSPGGAITGLISGGLGNDSIQGVDTGATWNITGVDVGNLSSVANFAEIETLQGGNGIDTFAFASGGSFGGVINGGAGLDTVDLSAELGAVTLDLAASAFINIESYIGNVTNSTLIGANVPNTWVITGADSGTINSTNFSGFNYLVGNSQTDQFIVSGGSITGSINGGAGSDQLTADNTVNAWSIAGADQGSVTSIASFSQIENLTGGNQLDAFVFGNGTSISGNVNGGAGNDSVDFAAETGSVSISLGAGGFSNIESFIGNNTDSTLIGPVSNNTWDITGNNDGTVGTISFTNFNNLSGNVSTDTFQFQDGSTITGVIDGANGTDIVDLSLKTGVVNVTLGAANFSNIEEFRGNNTTSTLNGSNVANNWDVTGINSGTIGAIIFSGFNNLAGNANTDTFTLNGGSITGTINGGAGNDSLTADSSANAWIISSANAGSVTGISAFSNIENLVGNIGVDNFVFADGSSISASVDGGLGVDSVDQSAQSGVINIILGGSGFSNIENFTGNGTNSTLTGESIANSWVIDGVDTGTVGPVSFTNFSHLQGGNSNDSFTISGGSISGSINGGAGNDSIQADNVSNTWNITAADVGDVTGVNSFSNIETLSGNTSVDNFIFADGSSFSGTIDGANGSDAIDFSSETGAVFASLASGQYQNIETFIGNSTNSTLLGDNTINAWSITGNNSGSVNGIAFTGFNNITGNASVDTFTMVAGNITGTIDGGTGNDTLQADNITNTWNVITPDSGNLTNVSAFQNIDNLLGGNTVDSFNISANVSGNVDGGGGDDNFSLGGLVTLGGDLIGGSGTDVLNGPTQNSNWIISGADSGSVNSIIFSQIESLNGGSGSDAFTITNTAASNISGGISGGTGNDSLLVDYISASNRTINFDGGVGTDSISLSGSATAVTNSYVFGPASDQVTITTTSSTNAQTINGTGIETVADTFVADNIALAGSSGDDAMVLSPGIVAGTQPVSFQTTGMPALQFSNKTNLAIDAGLGNDSLRIDGTVALSGNMTISAETITEGTAGVLSADTLSFNQATSIGAAGAALATAVTTLQVNGPTVDAYISEANGLALSAANVSGVLDVTTASGDITSAGSITVSGTSAFSVGNGGSIILDNAGNLFAGTPAFSSSGIINNLTLTDNSSVDLPSLTLNGNLSVTATGAVTQAGALTVLGATSISAGTNSITLNNAANDFVGTVTVQNSGGASTSIADATGLILGTSSVGSGTLSISAADISQSGAMVQAPGAGSASFAATGGDIALTNGANDFTGTVYLVNSGAGNTALTESNGLSLGSSASNGGDLTIIASNGITLSGTTTSGNGDVTIMANTGNIQLGRVDSGSGRLTINAVTGDVIGNNSPITDPNLRSAQLEILAGATIGDFNNPISISVPASGTSFFSTGIGSANIIGLTGTILGGSVLVNDVAATNSAVGKGQSVSFLQQNLTPTQGFLLEPLYSISGGGLHLYSYDRFTGDDEDDNNRVKQ